jgi:cytochrome P450
MEDRVNAYPIWGDAARRDPHALYARLRAEQPIYQGKGPVSGNTFWFFTRYEDCVALLKDQRFIKDADKIMTETQRAFFAPSNPAEAALNRHMLNLDPPDHTRLRSLVHKAFTPRMIENLQSRVEAISEELLDALEQAGLSQFDLIEQYSYPLPVIVIAELLGIPKEDQDRFRRWTKALLFGQGDPAQAALETVSYFNDIFAQRRADPRDDLISGLLAAEEAGDKLDYQELLSMIFLLLVAGHETTVNLITTGMLTLMQHPQQLERLAAEPSLIRTAVEEMLRYHGPVENTLSRWSGEDTTFKGHVIKRGDVVLASLMSANRDADVFANADTFDITRDPNRHIAFGGGIHYCLGAPLARLEGSIAINALLRRLPGIKLAVPPESLVWNDQITLRGLQALPVIGGS